MNINAVNTIIREFGTDDLVFRTVNGVKLYGRPSPVEGTEYAVLVSNGPNKVLLNLDHVVSVMENR